MLFCCFFLFDCFDSGSSRAYECSILHKGINMSDVSDHEEEDGMGGMEIIGMGSREFRSTWGREIKGMGGRIIKGVNNQWHGHYRNQGNGEKEGW